MKRNIVDVVRTPKYGCTGKFPNGKIKVSGSNGIALFAGVKIEIAIKIANRPNTR